MTPIPSSKAVFRALLLCVVTGGCGGGGEARIAPVYSPLTGKLQLLKYDANGNGVVDTWSYMDGARVLRIEVDADEDGRIDRWEYYDAGQHLEKTGMSRANDGTEDAWIYAGADGAVERIEVSTRRDGRVDRIEHYEHSALARAEEDSDGDGQIDKWETYDGGRLAAVAFDTAHHGWADRRLIYHADGTVTADADEDGDGRFVVQK